jgi:hypothetical protein
VVCDVSALCKQLVQYSASLTSSNSSTGACVVDLQAADQPVEQLRQQQQQQPALLIRPAGDDSCTAIAVVDTRHSSWGWLGADVQLVLESRVLGQSLPARRLLDVTEHAAISSDMDAVEPDAWLQRGNQLLNETTHVTSI